jgi:hypothetical protein
VGFLWPSLWNQQHLDLIAGVVWVACWLALGVALRVSPERQIKGEQNLSEAAKTP